MPKWHWVCNGLKKIALFASRAILAYRHPVKSNLSALLPEKLFSSNIVKSHGFLLISLGQLSLAYIML